MSRQSQSSWVARAVARLYPEGFRAEFADEMAAFIDAQRAEARFQRGIAGRFRFALHLLLDTLKNVPREHLRAHADRPIAADISREDRMDTLLHDLRYAFRGLARRPGFALTVVLTLMLGIGANTAIFSIVNAVLLRPLPYTAPDQLVAIWGTTPQQKQALMAITDVEDMRTRGHVFQAIGMVRSQSVNLTGVEKPDRLIGEFVSASVLSILNARPAIGRLFTAQETAIGGGAQVAVISNPTWKSRFGGDPGIVGKTLVLNGRPHQVIGVTAADFQDPYGTPDVWLPITSAPNPAWFNRGMANVWAVGRLKPGVTPLQAQQDLDAIAKQLAAEYPASNATLGVSVVGLQDYLVGPTRPTLLIILGAVAVVLLIACANVANLQLARAASRGREMSVRAALGAGRSRLVRQLLTESLVLSLAGGLAGLIAANWAIKLLVAAVPGGLPVSGAVGLDFRVMLFSLGITLATGLVFGLAPALHAARSDLNGALRSRNSDVSSRGRIDMRNVFVAVQLALCIVLLVGAALFGRSLIALRNVDPGFRADHLLTAEFRLPQVKYTTPEQTRLFMEQALEALRRVPGTSSVAMVRSVPLSGNWGGLGYVAEGQPEPAAGAAPMTIQNAVSNRFFATMQIPLLQGRDFNSGDVADGAQVVIVNKEFAAKVWPGASALGKRVRLIGPPDQEVTVVGVVGNIQQRALNDSAAPQIYQPMSQSTGIFNSVAMRTTGDPVMLTNELRSAIWSVDRDQPVWKIRSMETLLVTQVAGSKFTLTLTGLFALLALLLATVGVYGVMSFAVAQRTREVGIRMALGARKEQVVRLVVQRGIKVVAVAVVAGTGAAVWAAGLVEKQLFGVKATDPVTLIVVPSVLAVVALLACWLPARRAARVDPAITLRSE